MKTNSCKILLVEDEFDQRQLIKSILQSKHYQVTDVETAELAIEKIEQTSFDLVISDWKLPGLSGEAILEQLKKTSPTTGFILITAHSDASHAISLIRAGADDYLPKPFDRSSLLFNVEKLLYARDIQQENNQLKQNTKHRGQLLDMIGNSSAMNRLFLRIEKAAPTSATILITGESGTGKELAAQAIHQLSTRKEATFLPVNCAAIPESLAEAELFGAEKGAYTGANKLRIGKIEAANGGTLFLDEIGELPLILQSKLLRFLQEGKISRVGASNEIPVDVRIVAATNRDLLDEVDKGTFRDDLYYRLNVIPVSIPALRHRQDDLLPLIQYFIQHFCKRHNMAIKKLTSPALKCLISYSWPGNVRQLRNSVERLVLLSADNEINQFDVDELELNQNNKQQQFMLPLQGFNWEQHEQDCLTQALNHCDHNKTQAAKLMGLTYKAFLYRLEKYQLN